MRQLHAMLKQIDKRLHNEMSIQASFHGIKIPQRGDKGPSPVVETTEEEVAAINKARLEAKARKAEEFERKRYG